MRLANSQPTKCACRLCTVRRWRHYRKRHQPGGSLQAIVIGFNVRADAAARKLSEAEGVQIRYYDIILRSR